MNTKDYPTLHLNTNKSKILIFYISQKPNKYNVEKDTMLSPGRQPLTTGSVLEIRGFFSVRFRNCIFYAANYCVGLRKTKHHRVVPNLTI